MKKKENEYDHLLERIYDQYDPLVEMLVRKGLSMADAQDVTQEVLIKASRKIRQLRDPDKLKAWVRKIAERDANKALKKLNAEREMTTSYVVDEKTGAETDIYETIPHKETVEDVVCSKESKRKLYELIKSTGKDESEIFVLHNVGGYNLTEIADARDENQSTIRSKHSRTRKKLQKAVGEAIGKGEL